MNINMNDIRTMMMSKDRKVEDEAIEACASLPLEDVWKLLHDDSPDVRWLASCSFKLRPLSLETIDQWLEDSDYDVRAAAVFSCENQDVPFEVVERGLMDSDLLVWCAAICLARKKGVAREVLDRASNYAMNVLCPAYKERYGRQG